MIWILLFFIFCYRETDIIGYGTSVSLREKCALHTICYSCPFFWPLVIVEMIRIWWNSEDYFVLFGRSKIVQFDMMFKSSWKMSLLFRCYLPFAFSPMLKRYDVFHMEIGRDPIVTTIGMHFKSDNWLLLEFVRSASAWKHIQIKSAFIMYSRDTKCRWIIFLPNVTTKKNKNFNWLENGYDLYFVGNIMPSGH